MNAIKNLLRKPSADELAQRELDEARRFLLDSQRSRDYHQKMCEFYMVRIGSLTKQIKERSDD